MQGELKGQKAGGRLGSKVVAALLIGTALGSITVMVPTPVQAQTAQQPIFAIRPQPLPSALTVFGQQTGLQVSVDAAAARGLTSPGATGTMTPAVALHRLLDGTGLSYRFTGASTVVIGTPGAQAGGANVAGAISLDTIDVQGETAWGPVQGYVASRSATGTKTDTPLIEVPQSISVVTRDQMEVRQVESLNETLKYTSGVYAESNGYQTSAPAVHIRGFNTRGQGVFFLNGLRALRNSDIEPYGMERVEVMRGPSSVLYGQNVPGGVIGLVTKRPSEKAIREVRLQGGSFDQKGGAFDFGGPVTEDKSLLYRFTGLLRDGGNGIDYSKDKRAFLSGALTWRPTVATEITAYGLYQKDDTRWNFGLPAQGTVLPNPNGRIPLTRYLGEPSIDHNNTELAVAGYNFEHRATDTLTFRQNLQYSREVWDVLNVFPYDLGADLRTLTRGVDKRRYTWDTFAVDNQAELKTTTGVLRHTVLFGVDYRWRETNQGGVWDGVVGPIDIFAPVYGTPVFIPGDNFGARQTENFTGIYLQDQIKLDRWILTLGGRYDWSDSKTTDFFRASITNQKDSAFTKRAGLGYEFDNGLVPYISYAESFVPLSGTTFDGSPYKPETGIQYEAGIKYQPKDTNLRITAAIFDLRRQNVLTPDLPLHPNFRRQIGEVTSRGFELEAVASLTSNVNLIAAYTYTDTRVTKSNDTDLGKRPTQTPPHIASFWADYTIREGMLNGLGFGAGVRYVSASVGDKLNTFDAPAYTVVDAMARYDIDNWRFSVNVSNLFDKQYVAGCFDLVQCNVGRGRTVIGKVSYRW